MLTGDVRKRTSWLPDRRIRVVWTVAKPNGEVDREHQHMMKPSHLVFRDEWNIRPHEVERHCETNDHDYMNYSMHARLCPTFKMSHDRGWRGSCCSEHET